MMTDSTFTAPNESETLRAAMDDAVSRSIFWFRLGREVQRWLDLITLYNRPAVAPAVPPAEILSYVQKLAAGEGIGKDELVHPFTALHDKVEQLSSRLEQIESAISG